MPFYRLFIMSAFAALFALAGCATAPKLTDNPSNQVQVVRELQAPTADAVAKLASARPYAIGPMDRIVVRVIGYEGYDTELQVDSSGRIQMPLVGSVAAGGKTPEALSEELTRQYLEKSFLKRARVVVQIKEIRSQYVSIEGAVRKPGVYPMPMALRLNGAIALAEGTNDMASLSNVAVFRTVDGKQYAALFNLKDIRRGLYAEPEIFPSDTIIVGENSFRRGLRDVVSTAPFGTFFLAF